MPVHLPEAHRFSGEDASFFDPVPLLKMIQTHPALEPVRRELDAAVVDHNHGPARAPGSWPLAYLMFVMAGEANVQPWYRRAAAHPERWIAAGFKDVPAYQTVWQRFAELEEFTEVFQRARGHLIDIARSFEPMVGMHISVDGTESQTHAQPQHACREGDDCPTRGSSREPHLPTMSIEEATKARQHEAEIEEYDDEDGDEPRQPTPGLDPIPDDFCEVTPDGLLFSSNGHLWLSRDVTAGTRQYKSRKRGKAGKKGKKGRGKVHHGHTNNKAACAVTGGVVAVLCTPANINESTAFPDLLDLATESVGCDPIAVMTDRGLVTDAVARLCTSRGITQVAPYRKRNAKHPARPPATDRVDEDGIPRCRHCGASGDVIRFSEVGTPRIWFRCPLPITEGCTREQSIACSADIRRLTPIPRTSPVYGALRSLLSVREHIHADFRTYYRVGGKTLRDRQRRIGIKCQQLRSDAATVVQWLWILIRQGWLGTRPVRAEIVEVDPGGFHRRITERRRKRGLLGGGHSVRRRRKAGSDPPAVATAAA